MHRLLTVAAMSALALACNGGTPTTESLDVDVFASDAALKGDKDKDKDKDHKQHFGAHVTPDQEVMPAGVVNTSRAAGKAKFTLNKEGTAIEYDLHVDKIENVTAAHIHLAPRGSNGPVVQWLYPTTSPGGAAPGGGRMSGRLIRGTFTASTFVGPLAGQPLSALLTQLRNGGAYVNIHTDNGVAPTNSGPGDFPGGEIRGQVEQRGH